VKRGPGRKLFFVVPAIAAAAALAWVGYLAVFGDDAEPATVGEAVTRFRAQLEASTPRADGLPKPGVYVYETRGAESIDALGGVKHRYPARSTITVTRGGCGLTLRWDVLKGRSTTWTVCRSGRALVLSRSAEIHTFFGREERTVYDCAAGSFYRPARDTTGFSWTMSCSTGETTEEGRGRVVGKDTLTAAGKRIPTVHIRVEAELTGKSPGTSSRDWWLRVSDALPIRLAMASTTSTGSAIGDVKYEEQATLRLQTLSPRR
jgi:hypothetical protein